MTFKGEMCFCQTCTMAKMKKKPFQNKGHIDVFPKQNLCYDISGPYPATVEGFAHSFHAEFLSGLITQLNNNSQPPEKVETLTSNHGGESLKRFPALAPATRGFPYDRA